MGQRQGPEGSRAVGEVVSAEGKQPVLLWAVGRVDWPGPWPLASEGKHSTAGGRRKGGFLLQVMDGRA